VLAVAFVGLAAAPAMAGITLRSKGQTLAEFNSLDCTANSPAGFVATSKRSHGFVFRARIFPDAFNGFRPTYQIKYGSDSRTDVSVYRPNQPGTWTNEHDPTQGSPGPQLTSAGSLDFKNRGRTLLVRLPLIYNREKNPDTGSIKGSASCRY
jgi:hypothetical protein